MVIGLLVFDLGVILPLQPVAPVDYVTRELTKHNIPALIDLPGVGRNFQDHYEVPVI